MPPIDIRTALEYQSKSRPRLTWWQILKETGSEWADDDAMTWAAAVACYALLALAPLLVIAVKLAAARYGKDAASTTVQTLTVDWMGRASGDAIKEILTRTQQQGGGFFAAVVSAVLVVISVGGAFAELQQAMNRIWKVKPKPGRAIWNFVLARLKSVVVVAIAAAMLFASVYVTAKVGTVAARLGVGWAFVTIATKEIVSVGVLTLIFALVYKTVPDAQIGWGTTGLGALISALLFEAGQHGVALYFRYAAPTSAFGAVGSLAAILIWIYYSAQIVFFGAEFTQVYAKRRGHGVRPSKHAQFLSQCDETETATPSSAPPGQKPPRPDRGPESPPKYGDVLGLLAPGGKALRPPGGGIRQPRDRYIAAGLGLAAGALLGSLGALSVERQTARTRQADAGRLAARLQKVRDKLNHVSAVQNYLDRENVTEQVEKLRQQVLATQRTPRPAQRSHGRGRLPGRLAKLYQRFTS